MPARTLARYVSALGAELVVGLLVLTACAWIFGAIAEDVVEGDTHVDTRLADWLHEHSSSGWTEFFEAVTWFGNVPVVFSITFLAALVLARRRQTSELQLLLLAVIGAQVLTIGLKLGFARERPFFPDPLATEQTYSFPSGHASMSLAVYGTLGFIAARHLPRVRARIAVLAAAASLVLLIGFSRLYLGVHFLTDVVAGFSLGLAWVSLCATLLHLRVRLQTSR
ncbi:MAG TPA: phosphatase PAP2 family protein [Gaiellaceae bacterium]|nr:phosphatase PAP2 family protein [Gaiellaceae bacterium]